MATQMNPPPLAGLPGLARRLVMDKVLAEADARSAVDDASRQKISLHTLLTERGLVDGRVVALALSAEFGVPLLDVSAIDPAQMPLKLVSEELVRKHSALPLFKRGNRLFVGVADITNPRALDEIKFHSNHSVDAVLVEEHELQRAIEFAMQQAGTTISGLDDDEGLENLEMESGDGDADPGPDASANDEAPIVKFVNKILVDAIRRGASDIHFEPYETGYRVRYRVDGVLRTVSNPPVKLGPRIASRLKVMSSLDIAERRVPQDGRMKLAISKSKAMDFRVSTLPVLAGEKVVMRILDGGAAKLGIEKLGYEEDQKKLFLDAIEKPYGMVLVTGPTGSGKTVSLYTALNILNVEGRNISTVEDPVEIQLNGINQVNINEKAGLDFASALRAFLRQDPDIIMVGEIRDLETAEIAIKAAQTGHLVLSTLHTNDAPSTLTRLLNMGVPSYNVAASVLLITAQRLARRLCPNCKQPVDIPPEALLDAGFQEADLDGSWQAYTAVGCEVCKNTGYKGRIGIYQVMPISEEINHIILKGGSNMDIAAQAKREGILDLRQAGLLKVKAGLTSLEEVLSVTNE